MVRIIVPFFLLVGLVVSSLSTPVKRTVARIEADITIIASHTEDVHTTIKAFAGTLAQGLVSFWR